MKIGVTSLTNKIKSFKLTNNIRVYELLKLVEFFNHYYSAEIVRNNEIDNYDIIILYNSPINFYGGVLVEEDRDLINKLNLSNKPIFYVVTDPTFAYKSLDRFENSFNLKLRFWERINHLVCTEDILAFTNYFKIDPKLSEGINFTQYFNPYKNTDKKLSGQYEFDSILYFGNNKGSRKSLLNKYLNYGLLDKVVIGHIAEYYNTKCFPYIRQELLLDEVRKYMCSLLLKSKEHIGFITLRFYELINNTIPIIDDGYDISILPNKLKPLIVKDGNSMHLVYSDIKYNYQRYIDLINSLLPEINKFEFKPIKLLS